MGLKTNFCTRVLINSAGILSAPGDLCLFSFSIANSNSKPLPSGTSGSAVFIYLPKFINALYIEQLREMVPPPSQNIRLHLELRRRDPNLTGPLEVASL